MVKEYRPVFNRTYLKILPWVVAIAIVLLTAKSARDQFQQPERYKDSNLYSYHHADVKTEHLRLIFSYPEPILDKNRVRHLSFQKAILAAANSQPNISAVWFKDRLQLDISATELQDTRLSNLLDSLYRQALEQQPNFEQQASAEIYLSNQSPEELALTNFKLQIQKNQQTNPSNELKDRIQTALLITVEQDEEQLAAIAQQVSINPLNSSYTPAQQAHQLELATRSDNFLLLTGTAITAAEQLKYRMLLPILGELLNQLKQSRNFNYRLLLEPSFAALIIEKPTEFSKRPTQQLIQSFNERLSEEDIHTVRKQLIKNYKQRLETVESRTQLFSDQLFYQQPTESAESFSDTLNIIGSDELKQSLKQLLDSNQSVNIFILPH